MRFLMLIPENEPILVDVTGITRRRAALVATDLVLVPRLDPLIHAR